MKFRGKETEYRREYYHKRRQEIIDYLGGKCVSCGSTEKLEFDHIDRKAKEFNIKENLTLESVKSEVNKCQLLCKPCHKRKTITEREPSKHGSYRRFMKCSCDVCIEARKIYNEKRRITRRKKNAPLAELADAPSSRVGIRKDVPVRLGQGALCDQEIRST